MTVRQSSGLAGSASARRKFTASNGEAKRKIAEGAVRLDDVTVNDPGLMIRASGQPVKLSLGRKRHGLLVALIGLVGGAVGQQILGGLVPLPDLRNRARTVDLLEPQI